MAAFEPKRTLFTRAVIGQSNRLKLEAEPIVRSSHCANPQFSCEIFLTFLRTAHEETAMKSALKISDSIKQTTLASLLALILCSASVTCAFSQESVLPKPESPFEGKIGRTVKDSTPDFPKSVEVPKGASMFY
jgi:hypothetical protein